MLLQFHLSRLMLKRCSLSGLLGDGMQHVDMSVLTLMMESPPSRPHNTLGYSRHWTEERVRSLYAGLLLFPIAIVTSMNEHIVQWTHLNLF